MSDSRTDELSYTDEELRSYLPTGWNLGSNETDGWDAKTHVYRLTVIDEVDFDWSIQVPARDAASQGRMEALRHAIDRTQRGRLGWRTKGLLGWRLKSA